MGVLKLTLADCSLSIIGSEESLEISTKRQHHTLKVTRRTNGPEILPHCIGTKHVNKTAEKKFFRCKMFLVFSLSTPTHL